MAYDVDEELEESTNRLMAVGFALMVAMALVFPLYRFFEPSGREKARTNQLVALATSGEQTWSITCGACHGLSGEGGIGPVLNSKQFLSSATDTQIELLVSVGVPGTQMAAFSQDHGGPLTSEQIKAVVTYMRSWEPKAPDRPDWRNPKTATPAGATSTTGR
jgi:mono/diheme cytochrome c family protein